MRFIGILNKDGGTLRTMDLEAFSTEARRILGAHGHTLDCRIVEGSKVQDALEEAAGSGDIDVLMAAGGDGTISSAAEVAFKTGVPLAVLPAGTMNLFARSLNLPMTLPEALEAIATADVRAVDVASANGKVFVHQYSVGIHARLVSIREKLTYKSRYGKMLASTRAFLSAVIDPPRFVAEIRTSKGVERREYSAIQVTNNPIGLGHLPHADNLEQGRLALYIAKPMSMRDLMKLFADIVLGTWKESAFVTEREVREATLTFPRRKTSSMATIDGELVPLPTRVELKIHPGALKVVAPASPEAAAAAA